MQTVHAPLFLAGEGFFHAACRFHTKMLRRSKNILQKTFAYAPQYFLNLLQCRKLRVWDCRSPRAEITPAARPGGIRGRHAGIGRKAQLAHPLLHLGENNADWSIRASHDKNEGRVITDGALQSRQHPLTPSGIVIPEF